MAGQMEMMKGILMVGQMVALLVAQRAQWTGSLRAAKTAGKTACLLVALKVHTTGDLKAAMLV